MSTNLILPKADIATVVAAVQAEIATISENAENLLQQADRAVIDSEETLAAGGDLVKIARANSTKAEDLRKKIVNPANNFVRTVNAAFKQPKLLLDQAKSKLEKKMTAHMRAAEEEARRQAEEEKSIAEERALAAAEASAKAGDDVGAEVILDTVAEAVEDIKPERQRVHGNFGSTTSTRRVIFGKVLDTSKFLAWVAAETERGRLPVPLSALIEIKPGALNNIARQLDERKTPDAIPGFSVDVQNKANVR